MAKPRIKNNKNHPAQQYSHTVLYRTFHRLTENTRAQK